MSLLQSTVPALFSLVRFNRPIHSEVPDSPVTFPTPQKPRQSSKLYLRLSAAAAQPNSEQNPNSDPNPIPKRRGRPPKPKDPPETSTSSGLSGDFPTTIPRKPRRGRRSEAVAVEDYVRGRLEQVFASIREHNADVLEGKEEVLKQRVQEAEEEGEKVHVVEEEDPQWPLDADVGWGVRASEYFEKHPIKNVVVDGVEIDWEGEMDEGWVQEITCLEWESFAFHPSPLIVLVFERYNRAADNWKLLKELEKAAKVYWSAKDRLPPRVEGATNEDGKGDSIWDVFSRTKGNIKDGSNGDIAVDQYHRYKEDVELMAQLGFGAYRFSISWSRIFPDGFGNKVNEKGIAYYNHLIDYLLKSGIQPYATLYHWDLPYTIQEFVGGWLSEKTVEYFALYAEVCFARFGDRVKHWITINEPLQTAINGYSVGIFAPGRRDNPYKEPYLAAHYQILAHAAAVDVYRKKFKATQGGEIGLVVDCEWAEAFSDKEQDKNAVKRRLDFQLGWFLDPIFYGDYPAVMRERLGDHLPQFTEKEKILLRNAIDFVGLNHYTSRLIAHATGATEGPFYEVQELERIVNWQGGDLIGERAASDWLYIVPWGLRKVLNYIAQKYKNPPIYVTENGMDDEENETAMINEFLSDDKRVEYFKSYLGAVAQAIRDGVDIRGYFAWSFLDNFEWAQGYTKRFGLVYVDYKDGLKRYPKSSALWFSHFLKGKSVDDFVGNN